MPYRQRKKPLRGVGAHVRGGVQPYLPKCHLCPRLPIQSNQTSHGGRLKLLSVVVLSTVDEFTREALATEVEHTITGEDVTVILGRVAECGTAPKYLRFDHGPGNGYPRPPELSTRWAIICRCYSQVGSRGGLVHP